MYNHRVKKQKPQVIVILGPTAVGKSDMAVSLSLLLKKSGIKSEVISADSRQVYKWLNIGAGKITKKEMKGVIHHGLDILSPTRKKMFSVSEFKEYADKKIQELTVKGIVPIICGGTGFYIDAVVDGVVLPEVPPNSELRKRLEKKSLTELYSTLVRLDPKRAKEIGNQNKVRLIRSIEIAKALGKVPKIRKKNPYNTLMIGLDFDKKALMQKVHNRALKRLKAGMVAEARALRKRGVTWKRMKSFGLEYGLLAKLLQKELTRAQFIERLLIETWQYAKRQRTWFKRRSDIVWFDPRDNDTPAQMQTLAQNFLNSSSYSSTKAPPHVR